MENYSIMIALLFILLASVLFNQKYHCAKKAA